jgi:hypothetical protein
MATGVRNDCGKEKAIAAHSKTVAADPHVPGPGFKRPTAKNVATKVAH